MSDYPKFTRDGKEIFVDSLVLAHVDSLLNEIERLTRESAQWEKAAGEQLVRAESLEDENDRQAREIMNREAQSGFDEDAIKHAAEKCRALHAENECLTRERDSRNDALDHIMRTCYSAETLTRRLEWIAQRAKEAIADVPFDPRNMDMPRRRTTAVSALSREVRELKAENERLREALTKIDAFLCASGARAFGVLWSDAVSAVRAALEAANE